MNPQAMSNTYRCLKFLAFCTELNFFIVLNTEYKFDKEVIFSNRTFSFTFCVEYGKPLNTKL